MTPSKSKPDRSEHPVADRSGGIDRARRARASALWAGYADALGWISELTDERGLARRLGGTSQALREPVRWRRRIGGKVGPTVDLTAGTYSDDTQLRLAVGRAIGPHGFDVEAFAAVEMPVWPAYALGGGLSSKAAAAHLAKPTPWFANFYDGWTDAGGNGVAMRIQPHVWAAREFSSPDGYLRPLIRDAVSTHGHPVALAGAALHAATLAMAMTGELPDPKTLEASLGILASVPDLMGEDPELAELWLPAWERQTKGRYPDIWVGCLDDTRAAIRAAAAAAAEGSGSKGYREVLAQLKLYEPSRRGSGVLTAIAAAALTWCERDPASGVAIAANALGSDTDTIGSMAGALYGAAAAIDPTGPLLDAELIASEANRLTAIAAGRDGPGHAYPDLLRWSPPRTQADTLVYDGERLHVLGLGPVAEEIGGPIAAGSFQWRRLRLALGQTLIIKSRVEPPRVPQAVTVWRNDDGREDSRQLRPGRAVATEVVDFGRHETGGQLFDVSMAEAPTKGRPGPPLDRGIDIDRVIQYLEEHSYDDDALAYGLKRVARDGTREQLVAFVVAIRDRLRRSY